jgi:type II secretory pathway component PulK
LVPAVGEKRRGLVLLLVLIVIAMLALGAYSFTNLMLAHHEAALITGRQGQGRSLVDSGVTAVQLFLAQSESERAEAGGIFDNLEKLSGVVVLEDDDPKQRGAFSVVSPNLDSSGNFEGLRHGLEDESGRLNLNVLLVLDKLVPGAAHQLLMGLPNMTDDVADAILDWMDPDDDPREAGCEVDYYSGLKPAYAAKNGPLDTVEELLLVRGVTPQLLFGVDANRNCQLDQSELLHENTADAPSDPASFRGWSAYLTLYSVEWNITPEGNPKVYLNTNDLNKLVEDMSAAGFDNEWITFIVAYRQAGPSTAGGAGGAGGAANPTAGATIGTQPTGELNMDLEPTTPIASILDLIGAQVQYTFQQPANSSTIAAPATLNSPFTTTGMAGYIDQLMDYATVNPAATIPGRININQAPATVLAGIPGMTPEIVDKIISQRTVDTASADPARRYETWLLAENIVDLPTMKTLMPFICGSGSAYRAQIVGYFQGGQSHSRAEVVFDATSPLPRILLWRDLTHLGRGYSLETLGVNYSK